MMGAVLHTVNVRISPEQVLYTINHAADDVILVNAEFLPMLEAIHDEDPARREVRADQRRRRKAAKRRSSSPPNTRRCSGARRRRSRFRSSTRTPARRRSTRPERPDCRKASITAIASWCCTRSRVTAALANAPHATFTSRDVYMPITPMFHVHAWGLPYVATMLGVKQVYPGPLCARHAAVADRPGEGDVLALRADDPADDAGEPGRRQRRPRPGR